MQAFVQVEHTVLTRRKYPDAMSGGDASDSQVSRSHDVHPFLGRMYTYVDFYTDWIPTLKLYKYN